MEGRTLPFGLGLLSLCAGIASLLGLVPTGLVESLPTWVIVGTLVVVVLVTALLGGRATLARTLHGGGTAGLPSRAETPVEVPGAAFDRELANLSVGDEGDRRERIKGRIAAVAVSRIAAEDGCSTAAARGRLDEGVWTDDRRAAALFTTEDGDGQQRLRERVASIGQGKPVFRLRAERAIAQLHAYDGQPATAETDPRSGTDGTDTNPTDSAGAPAADPTDPDGTAPGRSTGKVADD